MRAFREQDRDEILQFYSEWSRYRNERCDGLLDRAFENRDVDKVAAYLEELRKFNQHFMRMGTERLAELTKIYWPDEDGDPTKEK